MWLIINTNLIFLVNSYLIYNAHFSFLAVECVLASIGVSTNQTSWGYLNHASVILLGTPWYINKLYHYMDVSLTLRINGVDASCEVGGFFSHGCYGKVMDSLNCIYILQEALAWTAIGLAILEVQFQIFCDQIIFTFYLYFSDNFWSCFNHLCQ